MTGRQSPSLHDTLEQCRRSQPVLSAPATEATPPRGVSALWWFPPVVDDRAARSTAVLVVVLTVAVLVLSRCGGDTVAEAGNGLLFLGFVLRVMAGPRFDPFGQLSVRFLARRLYGDPVLVAGAPKRFAQLIGVVVSGTALGLRLTGFTVAADTVLLVLLVAAALEGFLGYCLGCRLFSQLQRRGIVSADIRADCALGPDRTGGAGQAASKTPQA
jgi:hypothetical protein